MPGNPHLQQLLVHHQLSHQALGSPELFLQRIDFRVIRTSLQSRHTAFKELLSPPGQHRCRLPEKLAPTDPFYLYQHIFADNDHELYDVSGDWEKQRAKLEARRDNAIIEILQKFGFEGVLNFSEVVSSPGQVGHALGAVAQQTIEDALLPSFLDSQDSKRKALISCFIWRRFHLTGWEWCDKVDKSCWTAGQIGQFLAWLPFTKDTWDRASGWLHARDGEYWNELLSNLVYGHQAAFLSD